MAKVVGLIFDLAVNPEAKTKLNELEQQLFQTSERLKKARKEGDKELYAKLRVSQAAIRKEIQTVNKTVREQIKDFEKLKKKAEVPADSLIGLRLRYSELRKEIDKTSKSDPDFERLTKEAKEVKDEIDAIGASLGDFRSQVGNYKKGGLALADVITGGLATGGITAVVQKGAEVISDSIQLISEFEKNLDELSSITGLEGEELDTLGQKAIDLSTTFGTTASDILIAYQKIGSAQPELLGNAEALAEVTRQAEILAKAAKLTLPEAGEILAKSLNQSGKDYRSAAEFVDILATSQQKGTATIGQLAESYKNVGSILKAVNLDFEQGNVLLQALAKGGLSGAEAGTKLRGVLLRLSAAGREELNPATQDFNDILGVLEKEVTTVTEAQKIFGQENAAAALTLIDQKEVVAELTGQLYEEGNALAQAVTNTDNLQGSVKKLTAQWQAFILSIEDGDGVISKATKSITDNISASLRALRGINEGDVTLRDFLFRSLSAIGEELDEQDQIVEKGNAIINKLKSSIAGFGQSVDEVEEKTEELTRSYSDLQTQQSNLKNAILDAKIKGEPYLDLLKEYNRVTKQLTAANSLFARSAKAIVDDAAKGSIKAVNNEIRSLKKSIEESNDRNEIRDKIQELISKERELDQLREKIEDIRKALTKPFDEGLGLDKIIEDQLAKANKILEEGSEITPVIEPDIKSNEPFIKSEVERLEIERDLKIKGLVESLEDEEIYNQERLKINEEYEKLILEMKLQNNQLNIRDRLKLETELAEKELALASQTAEKKAQLLQEIIDISSQAAALVSNTVFEIESNNIDQTKEKQLQSVEENYQARIEAAQGNTEKQAQLQEQLEARKAQIERRAAKERKALAKKEAIVQGALAIIKALATANFIAAALVTAQTAAQIAVIDSQQYARGGKVGPANISPQSNGDNVMATLKTGEVVLTKEHQKIIQRVTSPDIFKSIGVPGFAEGGVVGGIPQLVRPAQTIGSNPVQNAELAKSIAALRLEVSGLARQVKSAMLEGFDEAAEKERQRKSLEEKLNV